MLALLYNLYYVKQGFEPDDVIDYTMLPTGIVIQADKNQFNKSLLAAFLVDMNDVGSKPNQRLLDQFASYMNDSGYSVRRDRLWFIPCNQRVVSWDYPGTEYKHRCEKVILSSQPVAGKSYLHVTVMSTGYQGQYSYSFVAHSPKIIFQKLLNRGLVDPNKKGGSDA